MTMDEITFGTEGPAYINDEFARSPEAAYDYLSNASFSHARYPETVGILSDVLDDVMQAVNRPLYEIAQALEGADHTQVMSDDIFRFVAAVYTGEVEAGNTVAAFFLARLHYYEHFGHTSKKQAVRCLETAVADNVGAAYFLLSKCLLEGEGTEPDPERAFHLLVTRALLADDAGACYLLGDMYAEGIFVTQNAITSSGLYSRAWDICNEQRDAIISADVLLRLARVRLETPFELTEDDSPYRAAQFFYQQAELYCYDQLDLQFPDAPRKLEEARAGQKQARQKLVRWRALKAEEDTVWGEP